MIFLNKIPLKIWLISFSSFFLTCSSAMLFSVAGLFMNSIGINIATIGKIDGIVEGISHVTKLFSGIISDLIRKRKSLYMLGVIFSAIAKPILFFIPSTAGAVSSRVFDRLGNGIQSTPRDALISDSSEGNNGKFFGLRQALGTFGSVIATLITSFILYKYSYKHVFIFATIPAFLALMLTFFIKEPLKKGKDEEKNEKFTFKSILNLEKKFWFLMIIAFFFMAGRVSESFLILVGKTKFNLQAERSVIIILFYNLAGSIISPLIGKMSDKKNGFFLILIGHIFFVTAGILLEYSTNIPLFIFGVILWGVQISWMQTVFCVEISRIVSKNLKGTAFGIFYFLTAIGVSFAGFICEKIINSNYGPFTTSIILGIFSSFILLLFKEKISKRNTLKS